MQNKPSNNTNEKIYSQALNLEKENITCKDGFCSINNKTQSTTINKDDLNLFDPI
mgnify:CR=1 FL=1|tara:strand:- start:262 stop:426 length:165 start_codon:yes stop_codon:yes gene_type:complete